MSQPRKRLIIEEHVLSVCPYCWSPEELEKEYPELIKPRSGHLCEAHFQLLLSRALFLSRSSPDSELPKRQAEGPE